MDPYRLPRTVVPSHYDLRLTPTLDAGTFTGAVAIEVDVADEIDEVMLNAAELTIGEAWLENPEGIRRNATVTLDEEAERATLALEEPAAAGPWTVHLAFAGILNDKLHGFYRSTFVDDEGVERVIATTQFEATSARRAFPCWDEPDFKATFGVTLVVPDDLFAVSNGAEIGREPAGAGTVAVTFADTMVMSTYLVAFVVGPLEATEVVDAGGTPLRVVHPLGKGHLADFALEVGAFALAFFEEYYGIPYPGDKVDLVAVPDFAFGAMENLGCITFREVLLLVDPDAVTQPELQRVVDVIAHELAHMWFGDLVTMKWWNGIWLNEAFATFMEMLCTDAFRPEWERWVDFGLSRTAAFDVDSLASTRPIEFEVVSPADSEGMFDVLTYEKGAAVVRMLEQWTGPDDFRAGIRSYLETHRYANTETTDLWDAIEAANPGLPVRKVMDSWIFQGGYPLVTVERTPSGVRLSQQRFSFEGGDEVTPTTWSVPVLVRAGTDEVTADATDGGGPDADATAVSGERVERALVEGAPIDLELGEVAWVQANASGSGFYRVDYDAELRTALAARAQEVLAPIERYGLVDDTWASVLAGRTTTPEFCEFVGGFSGETDLAVWQRLLGALDALDRLLEGAPRQRFQGFVRDLVGPAAARLGPSGAAGERDRDRELRAALFTALGTTGADADVRDRARTLLASHDADPGAVDPSLAAAAVAVIAATGDTTDRDDFLARYRAATTPQDEQRYLRSLPDFNDPGSFADTLTMTLSEVRSQDAPFVLRRALINRERGAEAWAFLRDHWDDVGQRLPSNSIARLLEGVRWLSDPEVAADVTAFLGDHPVPQGARTIAQHLERLAVNVALRRREADRLAAVFGG
ncbi:MAG: ERAP1-like C-terminal domain-containing protein [Acidimicrobiales bacterium]|nr:ERAP1-like C-terminal domain-containing protein [Acidimicrobiales bacterium]